MIMPSRPSPKPIYPSLYISGVENLDALPREGYALIHFKRRSVTLGESDGENCCSADLEIHEIKLPEASSDEDSSDLADAMKTLAKGRGLDTGPQTDDDEYVDEDEEN